MLKKGLFRVISATFLLAIISCSEEEKKQIVCWGDSLTAPHTGKGIKGKVRRIVKGAAYPEYLEEMLGNDYEIINCGVGGENTLTIMARQGAYPMKLAHDVVIFKSDEVKYKTFIGNNDVSAFVSSYNGKSVTPLLQCGWDEDSPAQKFLISYGIFTSGNNVGLRSISLPHLVYSVPPYIRPVLNCTSCPF